MKKLSLATCLLLLCCSISSACDQCGATSCSQSSCCSDDSGLLDSAASFFGQSKKSRKKKKHSACDCSAPVSCGCELTPSCGCETTIAPDCGCESLMVPMQSVPSCGCETGGCSSGSNWIQTPTGAWDTAPGASCEPLLSRLFRCKKKNKSCGSCDTGCDQSCDASCDMGCTTCETPTPSCGCEFEPTCGMEADCDCAVAPSCGCPEPSCGVATAPSCGCEAEPTDGLLTRFFSKKSKKKASAGCGCEISEPSCGAETSCSAEPTCGMEPSCGCVNCAPFGGYSSPHSQNHFSDSAPTPPSTHYAPSISPMAPAIQPQPQMGTHGQLEPIPAPAPPTETVPRPVPVPDSQVDPFRDDGTNNVRRLPASTIQYRRPQQPSYGDSYDPQARTGVRMRITDMEQPVQFTSAIEDHSQARNRYTEQQSHVVPASAHRANHHGLREVPRSGSRNRYSESIPNPLR